MSPCENGMLRMLLAEACRVAGVRNGHLFLVADGNALSFRVGTRPVAAHGAPYLVLRDEAALRAAVTDQPVGLVDPKQVFGRGTQTGCRITALRLDDADGALAGVIVLEDERTGIETAGLPAFARLAGVAAGEYLARENAALRLSELTRQHMSLKTVGSVERRFGQLVGGPGGAAAMAELCAQLTGKAVVLFAADEHVVASAGMPPRAQVARPELKNLLDAAWNAELDAVPDLAEVPPRPLEGLHRRHLLARVHNSGEDFGWLVALEHPSRLRPYDGMVLRCASDFLARELSIQRRVASVAWNARSSLARQLVRGTNDIDDLRTSGEYLGVKTEARRVLVYAIGPLVQQCSSVEDLQRMADRMQHRLGLEVLATRGSEAIMLLVEAPEAAAPVEFVARIKAELRGMAAGPFQPQLTAGVSSVCDPSGLARAYREAREVAHCLDRFAPRADARVLAVDDLGPARLFIANSAVTAVRDYVDDVLGKLLTGEPSVAGLVTTLSSYFACGRSVRNAALDLGVHENTVRLRLSRVHAVTGLDVAADANDQLSAQTALLVLRLQGHPALPAFDDGADLHSSARSA